MLLARPDHLGDLVLATPVLDALQRAVPNAQITLMVGPWSSEVVARHPAVERLLTCPFPGFQRGPQHPLAPYMLLLNVARQLRQGKYDLAINLRPDFWWGAALLYLAGIPHRLGYDLKPGAPFLTRRLPFNEPEMAAISNLRLASAALETLGYAPLVEPYTPERYPLQFTPTPEEEQWVADRLASESVGASDLVVVIHPGTGAAVKLWRNEAWAACANALPRLLPQAERLCIILTGSSGERPILEEIAGGMHMPPLILTNTTVGQLAALMRRATLALGVDNGPMHLAVAQGTPTLSIFGPTDPRIFGPWGAQEQHIVVASTRRCATCPGIPCGRLDFRPEELPEHPCARLVTVGTVTTAIKSLLAAQEASDIWNVETQK